MAAKDSFSRRNRYAGAAKVILIREDAPEGLRVTVLDAALFAPSGSIGPTRRPPRGDRETRMVLRMADPVFARHETVHPRNGWLRKGYEAARGDPQILLRKDAQ